MLIQKQFTKLPNSSNEQYFKNVTLDETFTGTIINNNQYYDLQKSDKVITNL